MALKSSEARPSKDVSASASRTTPASEASSALTWLRVPAPDAGARSDQRRVLAFVGEEARESFRALEWRDHDGRELGGIDGKGRARRRQRHQPGAGAQRPARTQARRACASRAARDDDGMTAAVFVALRLGPRETALPQRRCIGPGLRPNIRQHVVANSDIGDPDLAAMQPPGQEEMARLAPEERHRRQRLDAGAHDIAGGAVDAARNVDGDDRRAGRFERRDHLRRRAVDRPRQTGTEKGVDRNISAFQNAGLEGCDRTIPAPGHFEGIAFQPVDGSEQSEPDPITSLAQMARGDEAVTAIIAGPAQDRDSPGVREAADHFVRDGAAGVLHQHRSRNAALDGQPIRAAHLGRGEKLVHGAAAAGPSS